MIEEKRYIVWVGGSEVNDHYITKEKAEGLAQEYIEDGYDDVIVEEVIPKSIKFIKEDA